MKSAPNSPWFHSQQGYTLVELAAGGTLIGALLLGAMHYAQILINTSRANDTINSLSYSIGQINKVWSSSDDYKSLNVQTATAAGVFPDMTHVYKAGVLAGITNKFNMPVNLNLAANLPITASDRGFSLIQTGIPKAVCAEIVRSVVNFGFKAIVIMPEKTPGTLVNELKDLGLSKSGSLTGISKEMALALDPVTGSLDLEALTGVKGCGAPHASMSLAFVTWK